MKLTSFGKWVKAGDRVVGDQVEQRIHDLILRHLKKIATNPQAGSWKVRYLESDDGRYWELTYPHGEMRRGRAAIAIATDAVADSGRAYPSRQHGGGPRRSSGRKISAGQ